MFPEQIKVTAQITHLFTVAQRSECRIRPHFFLTGPTGSGKSYLVNQVAEEMGIPFFEINAAQLTAEGLSGNSLSKAMRPPATALEPAEHHLRGRVRQALSA